MAKDALALWNWRVLCGCWCGIEFVGYSRCDDGALFKDMLQDIWRILVPARLSCDDGLRADDQFASSDGNSLGGGVNVIKAILPIYFLAYIWSLAGSFGALLPYVPSTPGLGAFSGLSLIGAYAVSRACAETGWLNRISKLWCAVVLVVLSPIAAIRFGAYNSPVALVMAACAFRLFEDVRVAPRVESIVKILSPSLFSIYLLQINGFVFSSVPKLGIYPILTGVVIFVCTLVLDAPRRLIGRFIKR